MLSSFDTGIRRAAALIAAVGLIALVIVPVTAGKPMPAPNGPAIQDIRTQGHNWAAKALLLDVNGGILRRGAQDIRARGRYWPTKGTSLDSNGSVLRTSLPSAQDIRTQGVNWAAKGRLLDANGGLLKDTQVGGSENAGFHWNEFGIGAGVMLALLLLVGVAAAGIRVVHSGSLGQGEGRAA
jgi:hypothetical protein